MVPAGEYTGVLLIASEIFSKICKLFFSKVGRYLTQFHFGICAKILDFLKRILNIYLFEGGVGVERMRMITKFHKYINVFPPKVFKVTFREKNTDNCPLVHIYTSKSPTFY